MSQISGLLRETGGPHYRKAALVVAVTAGTGALVYGGYRYWKHTKPVKPGKKEKDLAETETFISSKNTKQVFTTEENLPITKPEDKLVLKLPKLSKPSRTDELSVSGTFEKISLGGNNGSDNFEHVTMSQVQPTGLTPPAMAPIMPFETAKDAEQSFSLLTISQVEDVSNVEGPLSLSFVTMAEPVSEEEQQESFASEALVDFEESSRRGESQVVSQAEDETSAETSVNVKDENDIIIIEKTLDDSKGGITEESIEQTSQTLEAVHDFDPSRVSPVFGGVGFHQVDVNQESFDPSLTHPSSFGYEFEKEE